MTLHTRNMYTAVMRFLLLLIIACGIGAGVYYVVLSNGATAQERATDAQQQAQQATDAYRKTQEDYMRQLGE